MSEHTKFEPPYLPVEVDQATFAFPAGITNRMLPAYEDIPEEFRRWNSPNQWTRLFDKWFYEGLTKEPVVKEGLDKKKVLRHLSCCLRSYEPKHEHKAAGVSYLMSLWLEVPNEEAKTNQD